MRFNYSLSACAQAGDQVDDLRDQIEALGHEFTVSRISFEPPPTFNLVTEGSPEMHSERIIPLMQAGYQLILLCTEQPTLVTSEGLVWNYSTSDNWSYRAEEFMKCAKYFSAAWCYAPGAASLIRRWIPRSADIEMSWGRRFDRKHPVVRPTHDFCFFGGLTKRRDRVINEFMKRGHKVDVIPHESPLVMRDARVPNSKVVLDIKQFHWWDLVSSVRYVTALYCGRPAVAEWRSDQAKARWSHIVTFAEDGKFAETAERMLNNWQTTAATQLRALRSTPSLMQKALAVLPKPSMRIVQPEGLIRDINLVPKGAVFSMPRLICTVKDINLVGWKDIFYAIPQSLGAIQLENVDIKRFPTIKQFTDYATARKVLG